MNYTCFLPNTSVVVTGAKTQTMNYTIDHLLPLTDCCVRVYAENVCDSVVYAGPIVSTCGQSSDAKPSPVQNLSIISVSDHSLFIVWKPPANYTRPGVRYLLEIAGQRLEVVDQTYYFVNVNLLPSTSYTVEVVAVSSVGSSMVARAITTTKPLFPTTPSNVQFSGDIVNNRPILEWDSVSSVTQYVVFWQCNEINGNTTTRNTSVTIAEDDPLVDPYTWCTARVQSVNEIGVSDLSDASSIAIPLPVPSKPTCYLADDKGSSALFSFTVTDPFSLYQLSVDWKLNISFTTTETSNRTRFTTNTLSIPVRRNTEYLFSLRLCNLHGCGDYCSSIGFTTNTVSCDIVDNLGTDVGIEKFGNKCHTLFFTQHIQMCVYLFLYVQN